MSMQGTYLSLGLEGQPENGSASSNTSFRHLTIPTCQWILYISINGSKVRIWDVIILVPNCLLLLYLVCGFSPALTKLRASNSPVFTAFFGLVVAVSAIGLLRCIVSMTIDDSTETGNVTNKVLWLILRFFLLATELSVVIFGLAFGHLDSRTSIQRVLLVTFTIALGYSVIQGTLEMEYDHPTFKREAGSKSGDGTYTSYDLFAHGGMIFLSITSIFFFLGHDGIARLNTASFTSDGHVCHVPKPFQLSFLRCSQVYTGICLLHFTKIRERFHLPTKRLFYCYCGLLACLNLSQAVSSLTLYFGMPSSLCVVDLTTYLYFSFYDPLVYGVFLYNFFKASQTSLQFSYKPQEDYGEDEVSLPYSSAGAGKLEDHAPIFSYNSTHFDVQSFGSNTTAIPSLSINSDNMDSNDTEVVT